MAFQWKFTRQPNLSDYVGSQIDEETIDKIAAEMQGYRPNSVFTPTSPAEQAAASMNGYKPNAQFSVPNDVHGGYAEPNLDGYGESLEAASVEAQKEIERQSRIEELQSKIELVQNRINENMAKLNNFSGSIDSIAALEAQKINSSDPTSFWRWNIARQDTKEANNLRNTEAKNKFANEIYKWEHREFDPKMKAEEVRQEVRNIESAIQEGKNIDADVSPLEKVRQKLLDRLNGKGNTAVEEWNNTFDAFMTGVKNGKYTKAEIDEFRKNNANSLSGAQDNTLLDASIKAGKAEIAKANAALEEKAKELFKKDRPHEDWDDVSENTKKTYRDLARGK